MKLIYKLRFIIGWWMLKPWNPTLRTWRDGEPIMGGPAAPYRKAYKETP